VKNPIFPHFDPKRHLLSGPSSSEAAHRGGEIDGDVKKGRSSEIDRPFLVFAFVKALIL
jgi:hypothetical protein